MRLLPRATVLMGVPTFYTRLLADAGFTATLCKDMRLFISGSAPLLAEPLLEVVNRLGDRLLRVKGFVHIAGEERRGFLERAGIRTSLSYGDTWDGEAPRTELVFIGEELDEAALRRQLWACRTASDTDAGAVVAAAT